MIAPAIISSVLLLSGSVIYNRVLEARDVTTEAVKAVTESGSTVFTTVTSIIKPTSVHNVIDGNNRNNDRLLHRDLTSTATPIDASAACYCPIPVTTATACSCRPAPINYVDFTTPQSIDAPTTQSVAAAASEETADAPGQTWRDNVLLRDRNGAVTRLVSVQLAAVATFFGIIGVGVVFSSFRLGLGSWQVVDRQSDRSKVVLVPFSSL